MDSYTVNFTVDGNNNDDVATLHEDKYSLRPRSLRRENAGKLGKNKGKSPPLSKYRRKTANARERNRMREINQAFEALRRVVPHMQTPSNNNNEKLTKITTLRLAMKYINALSAALDSSAPESDCSDGESFMSERSIKELLDATLPDDFALEGTDLSEFLLT